MRRLLHNNSGNYDKGRSNFIFLHFPRAML